MSIFTFKPLDFYLRSHTLMTHLSNRSTICFPHSLYFQATIFRLTELEDDQEPPVAQVLFIALKDKYETVHEGLMRGTGGDLNQTALTLPPFVCCNKK